MIKLINNEFIKTRRIKIIFSEIIILISIFIMNKYSDKFLLDLIFNLIPFIGIIVSILFSGSICSEIENGTLRYYLTKPYKRWKIYLSKFICIYIYITITIIIINSFAFIITNTFDLKYLFKYYIYSIPIYFIGSCVLYLSTKLKSQSLCVGICIFLLSFSLIISQVLFEYDFNIIEYTFLPYLDYSIFNDKVALNEMNKSLGINLSLNRGVVIDTLFIIIFYLIGNHKFNKKDIKN